MLYLAQVETFFTSHREASRNHPTKEKDKMSTKNKNAKTSTNLQTKTFALRTPNKGGKSVPQEGSTKKVNVPVPNWDTRADQNLIMGLSLAVETTGIPNGTLWTAKKDIKKGDPIAHIILVKVADTDVLRVQEELAALEIASLNPEAKEQAALRLEASAALKGAKELIGYGFDAASCASAIQGKHGLSLEVAEAIVVKAWDSIHGDNE